MKQSEVSWGAQPGHGHKIWHNIYKGGEDSLGALQHPVGNIEINRQVFNICLPCLTCLIITGRTYSFEFHWKST